MTKTASLTARQYAATALVALLALTACGRDSAVDGPAATFYEAENPDLLSAWGIFSVGEALSLADGVVAYDLNTPLFTDYAHKLRTIWMPTGMIADYREGDVLDFPVGTVISKTFYYPTQTSGGAFEGAVLKVADASGRIDPALSDMDNIRLVETRLLVHRESGWTPLSYVWNDAQDDATLTRIGDVQRLALTDPSRGEEPVEFTYVVPNINQCAGCHAPNNTTRAISPIGPKPRHLNKDFVHGGAPINQLTNLVEVGYLRDAPGSAAMPRNADWRDAKASLDQRARAYLDANCAHCHNPVGPADTSGLTLTPDEPFGRSVGLCKLPIAAGSGTGGFQYSIVPGKPEESIFVYRLASMEPDEMMPELGRSLAHEEGAALIAEWIAQMEGDCL